MEFSRIGEHTIKCVISEEEIYDLGYTMDEIMSNGERTQEFMNQIFDMASEEFGTDFNSGIKTVRADFLADHTLSLTFSECHSAHQRGGEHRIHLRILEPLLQLLQLGASLITQGNVRTAADVQALQITGRHAVADEMKFERFHGKTPLSGKEFLFAVKFRTGSGHPARAVRHKICVDYL